MDKKDLIRLRKKLNKTQKQLAPLLNVSLKTIHSYEQGLRSIPPAVERMMLLLLFQKNRDHRRGDKRCWEVKKCPRALMEACPAPEFNAGEMCWFINGTVCEGEPKKKWADKMEFCRQCEIFVNQFDLDPDDGEENTI